MQSLGQGRDRGEAGVPGLYGGGREHTRATAAFTGCKRRAGGPCLFPFWYRGLQCVPIEISRSPPSDSVQVAAVGSGNRGRDRDRLGLNQKHISIRIRLL